MRKLTTRFCAMLLAVTCCFGLVCSAYASTRASLYLSVYTAAVTDIGGGYIEVTFNVIATQIASASWTPAR